MLKKALRLMSVTMLGICTSVGAGPLTNGDFETGDFTGWEGELLVGGRVDPDADPLFSILPNEGPSLSNVAYVQNNELDWNVELFQEFTLSGPSMPGATLKLNFWLWWQPTDVNMDMMTITLIDTVSGGNMDVLGVTPLSDLTTGAWVSVDITPFAIANAGNLVELEFLMEDGDALGQDAFMLDEVSIVEHAPPSVPEPPAWWLLCMAVGVWVSRRRRLGVSWSQKNIKESLIKTALGFIRLLKGKGLLKANDFAGASLCQCSV